MELSVQKPSGVLTRYATHQESGTSLEDDEQLRNLRPKGQAELQETSAAIPRTFLRFN